VLKHFQAATAQLHATTPDEGAMNGILKPEIRNVLKVGWTVVRGILELAIMVYVLGAILDPGDTIIVAVLGIIYATIRPAVGRGKGWDLSHSNERPPRMERRACLSLAGRLGQRGRPKLMICKNGQPPGCFR
jgi:hypothetical protein